MNNTFSNSDDIIDVRDIIERIEELEQEEAGGDGQPEELTTLLAFMNDLKGTGGDEQWRGDWYPVTLIRDSYFRDYVQELADSRSAEATYYACVKQSREARAFFGPALLAEFATILQDY